MSRAGTGWVSDVQCYPVLGPLSLGAALGNAHTFLVPSVLRSVRKELVNVLSQHVHELADLLSGDLLRGFGPRAPRTVWFRPNRTRLSVSFS